MLRLEFPNETHREMYEKMQSHWKNYPVSRVASKMVQCSNFSDFITYVKEDRKWRPWLVPASFFFLIQDWEIIGHIQIRHHINHPNLRDVGGHIGYGIVPWKQWKGYGKQQLKFALEEAKKLWLKRIMISCISDNIASAKIIEANGWVFERERVLDNPPEDMWEEKWKILKIYWITL